MASATASAGASAGVTLSSAAGKQHTTQPIVTGTSVVAIKYKDGILMAADTLGSYGGLARFTDLRRIRTFGKKCIIGSSGEYSDFQHIIEMLHELQEEDLIEEDGRQVSAQEIHQYLTRVMYNRRNKFNPLWNSLIVAGVDEEAGFTLGTVDRLGTSYEEDFIVTGFGGHMAMPIIRESWKADMSEEDAVALVEQCMRVLYYRDCRTINKVQLAKITADAAVVSEPYTLGTKWDFEAFVKPKAGADTDGSW